MEQTPIGEVDPEFLLNFVSNIAKMSTGQIILPSQSSLQRSIKLFAAKIDETDVQEMFGKRVSTRKLYSIVSTVGKDFEFVNDIALERF